MDRFFLPPEHWNHSPTLTEEEAHHCTRVMRKSPGDEIEIFDGEGRSARAILTDFDRRRVALDLSGERLTEPPSPRIELAVGIPKGKLMDLIIQKAVELGVNRIVPLTTAQGTVQLSGKDAAKKTEKWQRVALESCKQCGQNWLPEVALPLALAQYLEQRESPGLDLIAALTDSSLSLREIYRGQTDPDFIRFLVGPEGDFSTAEYALAGEAGFQPVSLGKLVLRVETAAFLLIGSARVEYP